MSFSNEWRKYIKNLWEQQRSWQKQLDEILRPQLALQKQMESLLESQRHWQEQIGRFLEPQRHLLEQVDKILRPQWALTEGIQKFHRQWQESINEAFGLQRQIDNLMSFTGQWQNIVDIYLSQMEFTKVEVDASGSLVLDHETYTLEEVERRVDDLGKELEKITGIQDFLAYLYSYLNRLKKPFAQFLLYVILPYIIAIFANLTTPLYEQWWTEYAIKSGREHIKIIKKDALLRYDSEQLKDHRIVIADALHVRNAGTIKAGIIAKLHRGKIVRLLRKEKRWSLIEYSNDDIQQICRGWVFSRYLERFLK
jgi:hypothetical protein